MVSIKSKKKDGGGGKPTPDTAPFVGLPLAQPVQQTIPPTTIPSAPKNYPTVTGTVNVSGGITGPNIPNTLSMSSQGIPYAMGSNIPANITPLPPGQPTRINAQGFPHAGNPTQIKQVIPNNLIGGTINVPTIPTVTSMPKANVPTIAPTPIPVNATMSVTGTVVRYYQFC